MPRSGGRRAGLLTRAPSILHPSPGVYKRFPDLHLTGCARGCILPAWLRKGFQEVRMRATAGLGRGAVLLLAILVAIAPASAKKKKQKADEPQGIAVPEWLVLGPVAHPLPVFHDADEGGYDLEKLVEESALPSRLGSPAAGEPVDWFAGDALRWQRVESASGPVALEPAGNEAAPTVAWAAAYVSVDRWRSLTLDLTSAHPLAVWLDGEKKVGRGTSVNEGEEVTPLEATLELTPGKHLLLVRAVHDPDNEADWKLRSRWREGERTETAGVVWSTDRARQVELRDILDPPQIGSFSLSPDGADMVVSISRGVPGTHRRESWIEIRSTENGAVAESWRGAGGTTNVAWSPDGRWISYVAASGEENRSTLFLHDRENGRTRPLMEGVENLRSYSWSPDGRKIVFSTETKAEADKRGVKLLQGLMDRWATYRDKQFLHVVSVPDGARRRLTAGELSTSAEDISPDGKTLLFARRVEDLSGRPYSRTELWRLDLETFESERLRDFSWFNSARFDPAGGGRLLIRAHASEFGDAGVSVRDGQIVNSYDGQLFLWNPDTDDVQAITREFDPAVASVTWSPADNRIWFTAGSSDHVNLYRYDPATGSSDTVRTGFEVTNSFDVARSAPVVVATGSSVWRSQGMTRVDPTGGAPVQLPHPGDEWFSDVGRGIIESWSFKKSDGTEIGGRVYLPPGFDAMKKYPCIVYYYGGTVPVDRSFGGRYPKEWWASQGYVVYVPQPSGATGFGQEFSAEHVNNWGLTTAEEIIVGTRRFLASHEYVDPARVGCIGASYGGFMTMLLSTKTDLFAAAVAHAGISSISSYWGEGYWGYSYSSVASAESFPWNRRDIYVGQSPLFNADQHKVPILLTHGTDDTNVPKGESDQFYVALKLLGRDVEYLQIDGQDHWIVDHAKRQVWSNSIVAWFDRWLKDEPDWWESLYPSEKESDSDEASGG
jgi:dipeptidyl aminopeptidase/acylaminoacyl peptidase